MIATAIDATNLAYCADVTFSYDAADGLIDTGTNAGYLRDCDNDSAGGLLADIDAGKLTDFTDIKIS